MKLLKSWSLDDKIGSEKKRTQKNWLPFFTTGSGIGGGCELYLSKKFAPQHEVVEFTDWSSPQATTILFDNIQSIVSPSPAVVANHYTVRGSAPPIYHPLLLDGYKIGRCSG